MAHAPTKTHAEPQPTTAATVTAVQEPALPEKQPLAARPGIRQPASASTPPDDPTTLLDVDLGSAGRARSMRAMQHGAGNARIERMLASPRPALPGEPATAQQSVPPQAGPGLVAPTAPQQQADQQPGSSSRKQQRKAAPATQGSIATPQATQEQPAGGGDQAFGRLRQLLSTSRRIQARLTIGAPNDPYEQEAERMATAVSHQPASTNGQAAEQHQASPLAAPTRLGNATPMASAAPGQLQASADLQEQVEGSKGMGSPLPDATRKPLESALGADFRNVRVHTGSDAVAMNQDLGAHAFTHGSDIYFNTGKYDPGSPAGKQLLAHELTHTVQQGASARQPDQQDAQPGQQAQATQAPNIQAAWYNFSIPFTDYEFDPSIAGVKNAASIAKNTVVDSAVWVKDKVVAGVTWIYDKIKGLITAGIDWLNQKFSEIKEFAVSAFATVRNGLSSALAFITSPVSIIQNAFASLNAELLGSAWNALTSGVKLVWNTIKAVIDGVFKLGQQLWKAVSGFISSLVENVGSLINSWPFRQLPDFMQQAARSLFQEVQALWRRIDAFIAGTLKSLKEFTDSILQSIESFVQKVVAFAIQTVITTIRMIKKAWDFVKQVAEDPEGFIRPIINKLVAKLNTEAPPKAIDLGRQKVREAGSADQTAASGPSQIQRQPAPTRPLRTTTSSQEAEDGIFAAIIKAWAELDIAKMLWDSFVNMFWPPATIRAIGKEFSELWHTDWGNAVDSLFLPRNIFDDPAGFFHDIWSNLLVLLEFPLALWRRLNSILMLLMGYVTIILVIVGAVGGGIAGAGAFSLPGAGAGALAGLELAGALGMVLLASYFAAEMIAVIKWIVQLRSALQTQPEKDREYTNIAASLLGMAVAAVLVAILALLAEFVSAVVTAVKAKWFKPETKVTPPKTDAKPGDTKPPENKPPENKPPEEPKPAEPDPAVLKARRTELFNRARAMNKRAENLAKKYAKETDPEITRISEANDEILTRVSEADPQKLDAYEKTLDEHTKQLDQLEKQFAAEVAAKVEQLKSVAKWQKQRAHAASEQAADKAGGKYSADLSKIATDAEAIELELQNGPPEPKALAEMEATLEKNNSRLREIEHEFGIASKYTYVEEWEPGKYKLKPEYIEGWRNRFYECVYAAETIAERNRLKTTPHDQGGLADPTNPNLIWDEPQGKYVDGTLPENELTVDHNPQSVVDHWKSGGNNMDQAGRHQFFRDPGNHKFVLKKYNSSDGGKMSGSFTPDVGPLFSGPGGQR